jgi:YihY family inner membrane protein
MKFVSNLLHRHPSLNLFIHKVMQDNITFLASAVAWTLLTSVVPIVVGLVATSSLLLHDPPSQRAVVDHLSGALQGTLQPQDIRQLVSTSIRHRGVLALIGIVGILWGGSNVGGVFSTVFQPIFEVNGRDFLKEKLLDLGMIVIFVALMLVIVVATTAGAIITRLFPTAPIPGERAFLIGTTISLAAAFLLFVVLYLVFPNAQPRFTVAHVWRGALVAAILFQILSFMWPLYTQISHFSRYGAVIAPMIVLAAWIYFFSLILMVGAEIVAFRAIREANRTGRPIGPQPQNFVPSHTMMRDDIDHVRR